MASYLTGSSLNVVKLDALLPSQAVEEASRRGCEPLLLLKFTRRSSGGLTRALGRAAGGAAWAPPGGGSVGSAAARVAATAGLQTAASLAESTKAKDEGTLEYRLQSTGGQVTFGPKSERQKATVDGEDILTPVVARAAGAIVERRGRK